MSQNLCEGPLKFSKFFLSVKFSKKKSIRGSAQILKFFQDLCEGPLKNEIFSGSIRGSAQILKNCSKCPKWSIYARVRSKMKFFQDLCEGPLKF